MTRPVVVPVVAPVLGRGPPARGPPRPLASGAVVGLLLAVLGLALAGVDPAGALLLGGALAAGATRRGALAHAAACLVGVPLIGVVLSLVLGVRADRLDLLGLLPDGPAAVVEVALAVVLAVWAVLRLRDGRPRPGRRRRLRPGDAALLGAGGAWALSALLDPTFLSVVVLAARTDRWTDVVAAHALYSVVSQLPLLVLALAVLGGRHEPVVRWLTRTWERVRPVARHVLTAALLLVAVLLLADGGAYLLTGRFLVG